MLADVPASVLITMSATRGITVTLTLHNGGKKSSAQFR
jgi:hypothetical protein